MYDKKNEAQRGRSSYLNRKFIVVASIIVVSALLIGAWLLVTRQNPDMGTAASEKQDRQVLYWTDPMVPGYKSDKPGPSPFMDMQLVPVYADDADSTTVSIRPEIVQSLGVRTHKVEAGSRGIRIPNEALIRTGTRNAVVLAIGEGRYQPVEVTPGAESDDWVEIRHGIKAGDVVVTSGQFLIDSEANIRASFARMQPAESKTP